MYTQNKYVNRKVYLNVEQPKIDGTIRLCQYTERIS